MSNPYLTAEARERLEAIAIDLAHANNVTVEQAIEACREAIEGYEPYARCFYASVAETMRTAGEMDR